MTQQVHSVLPTMTVGEAVNMLLTYKISGAPIVNQTGVVMSVITEGDLLKLTAAVGLDKKISTCLEKLVPADKIHTINKSETCLEAYKMFLKLGVHRLIVADANGKLQGIVSRSNVLKIFVKDAAAQADEKTA